MKKEVYKRLTEPLYKLSRNDSIDAITKEIAYLCTELRLDQRSIAIIGIRKNVEQNCINTVITDQNRKLLDDNDKQHIHLTRILLSQYDVIILYREQLYFNLLNEICIKNTKLSPILFHYICTKLFGYSDRALHLFLKKWVQK